MTPDAGGTPKPRIWVLHCPFKKTGVPVLGTFGATIRPVVVVPLETWKRLCAEIPELAAQQFEVGSYDCGDADAGRDEVTPSAPCRPSWR